MDAAEVRNAFEIRCQIDMSRYRWTGTQYVHNYDPHLNIRADRINTLYEGFLRGAYWATENNPAKL